eukprot:2091835-Amphidinium_carterae.1
MSSQPSGAGTRGKLKTQKLCDFFGVGAREAWTSGGQERRKVLLAAGNFQRMHFQPSSSDPEPCRCSQTVHRRFVRHKDERLAHRSFAYEARLKTRHLFACGCLICVAHRECNQLVVIQWMRRHLWHADDIPHKLHARYTQLPFDEGGSQV